MASYIVKIEAWIYHTIGVIYDTVEVTITPKYVYSRHYTM